MPIRSGYDSRDLRLLINPRVLSSCFHFIRKVCIPYDQYPINNLSLAAYAFACRILMSFSVAETLVTSEVGELFH